MEEGTGTKDGAEDGGQGWWDRGQAQQMGIGWRMGTDTGYVDRRQRTGDGRGDRGEGTEMEDKGEGWGIEDGGLGLGHGGQGLGTWDMARDRVPGIGPAVGARRQGMGTGDGRLGTGASHLRTGVRGQGRGLGKGDKAWGQGHGPGVADSTQGCRRDTEGTGTEWDSAAVAGGGQGQGIPVGLGNRRAAQNGVKPGFWGDTSRSWTVKEVIVPLQRWCALQAVTPRP